MRRYCAVRTENDLSPQEGRESRAWPLFTRVRYIQYAPNIWGNGVIVPVVRNLLNPTGHVMHQQV
jgi:hypothetical protein